MTRFNHARTKHRIACVMLVFWLFSLGAGWANACVLQERGTHAHSAAAVAAGVPAVSPGHVGVADDHSASDPHGKTPCLKVCDDASQSLVKGLSGLEMPTMPLTVVAWSASTPALRAQRSASTRPVAHTGPPLRTMYSRLAL
jgi:hypothetical protein